jgi:hypothetical protein
MEEVRRTQRPVLITKRGHVVAQLAPPPPLPGQPWLRLRGSATFVGDVLSPAVQAEDIDVLR